MCPQVGSREERRGREWGRGRASALLRVCYGALSSRCGDHHHLELSAAVTVGKHLPAQDCSFSIIGVGGVLGSPSPRVYTVKGC